jgi:hypothetical protein
MRLRRAAAVADEGGAMPKAFRVRWFLGVLALAAGCERGERSPAPDVTLARAALTSATFTLPLLVGENPTDVALAAGSTVSVNDRATTSEAGTGDSAMVSNLGVGIATGAVGTNLGVGAIVGTLLSQPLVFLRAGSQVRGSLTQALAQPVQKQTNTTVTGVEKTGVSGLGADATWNLAVTWPATVNPAPNLEPGQSPATVALAPGAYPALDVKTGRTLRLSAGQYFLDGLTIEPGAGLQIDGGAGPVFAFILAGGFTMKGTMPAGVATPGMPVALPSLTIMTTGNADIEGPFTGVLIAPGGSIDAKGVTPNQGAIRGAFFGKAITLYESQTLAHYRDPFSFRGFGPADGTPFIGDRASVTGGAVRLTGKDVTIEAHQSEAVTAVSRNGAAFVVTVGYNDQTTAPPPGPQTIVYTDAIPDPRAGNGRLLFKGTSLMGWSFSTDGGHTFNYGGRIAPPSGWSIIWSDPSIAKLNIDDPNVYYTQLGGTTAAFESVWDPSKQAIVSSGQNVGTALDGYCIARSTDRGVTFPTVKCQKTAFQDGSALAVAMDASNHRQVYVTGAQTDVWRMDGDTMTFATTSSGANPISNPFPNLKEAQFPRMRVFGGVLYIVRQDLNLIRANRLNTVLNATTWLGETQLASDAGSSALGVETSPSISFDLGPGLDGTNKFRLMYTAAKSPVGSTSGVKVIECALTLDPASCQTVGWSTVGETGSAEAGPSLRFGGGQWVATWRKVASLSKVFQTIVGHLVLVNGVATLDERSLYPGIVPCAYDGNRWGEYNQLDAFGDGRFFAPYTINGPGCRWQGIWSSDAHVGGSVFQF